MYKTNKSGTIVLPSGHSGATLRSGGRESPEQFKPSFIIIEVDVVLVVEPYPSSNRLRNSEHQSGTRLFFEAVWETNLKLYTPKIKSSRTQKLNNSIRKISQKILGIAGFINDKEFVNSR